MASLIELRNLMNDSTLRNKVDAAVIIAADTVMTDAAPPTNQAERLGWARSAFENPQAIGKKMLMSVLAANKTETVATIQAATDVAIQANVDAAVDLFAV